jgi:hypothetical protein
MPKFAQGRYTLKNDNKYLGRKTPLYRSSWEFAFMRFCDESPSVSKWASESVKIPYKDPLTGKLTIYVPDFMIQYTDRKGKGHVELIEVKPENQMTKESVGRNKYRQAQYVRNMAKWEAARHWCKQRKILFRVINENDIFHRGKKR